MTRPPLQATEHGKTVWLIFTESSPEGMIAEDVPVVMA